MIPYGHVDLAAAQNALSELNAGRFAVLSTARADGPEGSLLIAADHVTPEAVNFMSRHGQGLVWLCLTDERCEELALEPLVMRGDEWQPTVSITIPGAAEAGASAADRAATILAAVDPEVRAKDVARPGNIFPLRARPGGVLQRAGRTEAAVDLARLAGCSPAGAISLIVNADGSLARGEQLRDFCAEHGFPLVAFADVIAYRRGIERLVERATSVRLPTAFGEFQAVAFRDRVTGASHLALIKGDVTGARDVLVRV